MNEHNTDVRSKPKPNVGGGAKTVSSGQAKAKPQQDAKEKPQPKRKLRRRWVRLLLGLLRALLVPVLCVIAVVVGLWLGYAYIGGREGSDIWEWDTWKHLFDLVFAG
ncbi:MULTISPECIES: DNA-directed RNA polymerase subunit beta [Paenibacillus]|jgi:hypothetical protein|uniref:DNA-directed RNA polymerase subunit beta n=1 Tax=Paenibacillus oceani TaxID=2772510 RepID=A0A927H0Y3_9BACL|nr:DNA-directed RNA polymerase subunit beta [Paenibacillus oceani]MBD2863612.1 DNA-directed RNA polymerase subunit beta [Paenibacillus oceani]MDF2659226.1 DNA-directed polymerase subunit beta [Paenibacillus sp.]